MVIISHQNFMKKKKWSWSKIHLSTKDMKALKKAEKDVQKPQLLKRIQCIKLKGKQWPHKEVADFFDIRIETVTQWVKAYHEGGIKQLLTWDYEGKQSVLTKRQQEVIKKRQKKKPFKNAKEAKAYIEKTFKIHWHLHWVQKVLKKNFDIRLRKPD